ncbi:MAG TPA: hypothetical protein VGF02_06435 [Pseudolabrys sp.]
MKKLAVTTSLVLAALAASPSFAATRHMSAAAEQAYAAANNEPVTAEGGLTAAEPAVIADDVYRGWDPDPNIRFQLLRDPNLAF